jgi:hypothetical protein
MYRNFQLKGINGSLIELKGLCREVPIKIGGARFDYHFFVTEERVIGHRRMVLGQPFLSHHAVVIEYTEWLHTLGWTETKLNHQYE